MIVKKNTNEAVFETFNKATADRVRDMHSGTHKVVPILDWLSGLNKR